MTISNTQATRVDARALRRELEMIKLVHASELRCSNVICDMEVLKWMTEESIGGSIPATYFLSRHGTRILKLIRERLSLLQEHDEQLLAA